jgi:hypothetical protein
VVVAEEESVEYLMVTMELQVQKILVAEAEVLDMKELVEACLVVKELLLFVI